MAARRRPPDAAPNLLGRLQLAALVVHRELLDRERQALRLLDKSDVQVILTALLFLVGGSGHLAMRHRHSDAARIAIPGIRVAAQLLSFS